MTNEEVIKSIHQDIVSVHKRIVQLENSTGVVRQEKLLAFKTLEGNSKNIILSGNVNGILTLARTVLYSLVSFGYDKEKLNSLKFPADEILTNSDVFITDVNIVDGFYDIDKIKDYKPTGKDYFNFYSSFLTNIVIRLAVIGLCLLGLLYIFEMLFFGQIPK